MAPSSMRYTPRAFIAARHAQRADRDASGSSSFEPPKPRRAEGFDLASGAIREMRPGQPNRV